MARAKMMLGVDIGHDQLKLALVKGTRVLKTVAAEMPENLLRQGNIVSGEAMSELIRDTMKQSGIRTNLGAFVLPNEAVYIKNVEMPQMSVDQLEYNLPFEFNDYITGDPKNYVFDYAMLTDLKAKPSADEGALENAAPTMEMMAVGTTRAELEQMQEIFRKAGLKLARSAPALCAYISLLRAQHDKLAETGDEYGILDLGATAIRMYMFRGDRHVATRVLETGLSNLETVLADAYGVDPHLARTYLTTNFEDCQRREECLTAYNNIAVELMRALNFYRFSNPDSALDDLWLCGGGAVNQPLREVIEEMLGIAVHPASELVPGGEAIENVNSFVQAIGITMS